MVPLIVKERVSQTAAPTPSTLQGTGYIISQGGTNTAAGTLSLITQPSDFVPLMANGLAFSSVVQGANKTLTFTTAAPHGLAVGSVLPIAIVGIVPVGYNGTYAVTVSGPSTLVLQYPGGLLGPVTTPGSYVLESSESFEATQMITTFFGQGAGVSVYVLELGAGTAAAGVSELTAYLIANPVSGFVTPGTSPSGYLYLVPREWDSEPSFLSLIASYQALTAKAYFLVTTTVNTYSQYTPLMKCVFAMVEAPGEQPVEFTLAAVMADILSTSPSSINRALPFRYSYLYGVTPYPQKGNAALLTTLQAAGVNFVATGAEGGITTAILNPGTTMDGNDFLYWYATDWLQIQSELGLANAIINGSNNPQAPLDYDQNGINKLQAVETQVCTNAVSFSLFLAPITVTAVPFYTYVRANPGDFKTGTYNGLAVTGTPARGFGQITLNINVNQFPSTVV